MAIKYLSSDDVSVFPSTRRGAKKPESRVTQESTFVDIINRICDGDGTFVITKPVLEGDTLTLNDELPFEFVIFGYYFKVEKLRNITNQFLDASDNAIYAYIELDQFTGNRELKGKEEPIADGFVYTGVKFSNTIPIGENIKYMKLFDKEETGGASWKTAFLQKNYQKITTDSLKLDIDGGKF